MNTDMSSDCRGAKATDKTIPMHQKERAAGEEKTLICSEKDP
jgi:hypothetical protein